MRKIELQSDEAFDAKRSLIAIVESPLGGKAHVTVPEMRTALRIAEKVAAADAAVLLEDSDFNFVRERVEAFPYPRSDKRVLQFVETILKAAEVDVQEAA